MDGIKSLLASKTFWGAALAVVAGILSLFGFEFGAADQGAVIDSGYNIAGIVGGILAIYGRIVASKKIGSE